MNKPFDLIWIIPEFLGEIFLGACIPIILVRELLNVYIFSTQGVIYLGLSYLLLFNMKFKSLDEFSKIRWKKDETKRS